MAPTLPLSDAMNFFSAKPRAVRGVLEGYATDRRLKHRVQPLLTQFDAADRTKRGVGDDNLPAILAAPIEL
jgi:hypothetical protein